MNQDKGKEISRTPRFILLHSSSRATSSLFPISKEITLKKLFSQYTKNTILYPTRIHEDSTKPYCITTTINPMHL